jgi:hypothetical protein
MSTNAFFNRLTEKRRRVGAKQIRGILAMALTPPTLTILWMYLSFWASLIASWVHATTGLGSAVVIPDETRWLMTDPSFLLLLGLWFYGFGQIFILPTAILISLGVECVASRFRPVWLFGLPVGIFCGGLSARWLAESYMGDPHFYSTIAVGATMGALMSLLYCWVTGPTSLERARGHWQGWQDRGASQ